MSSMFRDFGAGLSAYDAPLDARLAFVRRTYLHVAAAVGLLVGLSYLLLALGFGMGFLRLLSGSPWVMIGVMLAIGVAANVAQSMAQSHRSEATQYAALAGYVGLKAILFSPILAIVTLPELGFHPMTLPAAAGLTLLAFGGLSAYVLTTKKDLSFLGPILAIGMLVSLGIALIAAFTGFGFGMGLVYAGAMALLAAGCVLYTTSKVLHSYRTDEHVGAALQLFASIAMLFYYVLWILMQLQGGRRRD